MITKFSEGDKVIVRSLLRKLPLKQRKAIILRFWHNYSISDVARELRISWKKSYKMITGGLVKLRKECMAQPRFSRAA